jgi:hypothetical protein
MKKGSFCFAIDIVNRKFKRGLPLAITLSNSKKTTTNWKQEMHVFFSFLSNKLDQTIRVMTKKQTKFFLSECNMGLQVSAKGIFVRSSFVFFQPKTAICEFDLYKKRL